MGRDVYNGSREQKNWMWVIKTIIFDIVVVMLFCLIRWNVTIGFLILLLLLSTIFVGRILKACAKKSDNNEDVFIEPLPDKQKKDSQNLLRYATAVLAFLSLITTAQGMNSFVFDKAWMAYLASFATQSILVVFSLLLCRFYVQITVLMWSECVKIIVKELLIFFFGIVLIVSSAFSYTYIANNAYANTWSSDSELMIQQYLTSTIYELQRENDSNGKQLLDEIMKNAKEKLNPAIQASYKNELSNAQNEFQRKLNNIEKKDYKTNSVDIDMSELYNYYNESYHSMLNLLSNQYDDYKADYVNGVSAYNDIIAKIEELKSQDVNKDIVDIYDSINILLDNINDQKKDLEASKNNIDDWKSVGIRETLSTLRSDFKGTVNKLITGFDRLEEDLGELKQAAEDIINISESTAQESFDNILSQIYLLEVDSDSDSNSNTNTDTSDKLDVIIKQIIDIMKKEDLSSDKIQDFVTLKDSLEKYEEYLNLHDKLNKFLDNNAKKSYDIVDDESEKLWIDGRKEDFKTIFECLKTFDNQEIITGRLSEGQKLQRNLLENLTSFERAFNYFKSDFPIMACFSAFIAIFFDLGSFFTGCFLYCTEFFESDTSNTK